MARNPSERAGKLVEALGRLVVSERSISHVIRLQESTQVMRSQGYPDPDREEVVRIARGYVSDAITEARRDIDNLLAYEE